MEVRNSCLNINLHALPAMKYLEVEDFIKQNTNAPIIDVRSPAEYEEGHVPGAVNLPLFSNEERHIIGTLYKQNGKQVAVKKGLEFVGPKMHGFVDQMEALQSDNTLKMYCWRGGMRSSSMAWLAGTMGYKTLLLKAGYKSYRRLMETIFDQFHIILIGGETGSGKTEILYELSNLGEQVVDLEGLANHKGSAFGAIGQQPQPSNEQFQNMVIDAFLHANVDLPLFLEDESSAIGKVGLPTKLWKKMSKSPIIRIQLAPKERIKFLVKEYGAQDKSLLAHTIAIISKKLGGLATKQTLQNLQDGNIAAVAEALLVYYDKSYRFLLERKKSNIFHTINIEQIDFAKTAKEIAQVCQNAHVTQS
jgi:tRNA 2-selenouridine synthase